MPLDRIEELDAGGGDVSLGLDDSEGVVGLFGMIGGAAIGVIGVRGTETGIVGKDLEAAVVDGARIKEGAGPAAVVGVARD